MPRAEGVLLLAHDGRRSGRRVEPPEQFGRAGDGTGREVAEVVPGELTELYAQDPELASARLLLPRLRRALAALTAGQPTLR